MRLIDNQMMLQRPAELAAGRARENQLAATNINMAAEVEKDTQKEKARVQNMNSSEHAGLRPDKDGGDGKGYHGQEHRRRETPEEEEANLLNRQASARLTDLPVDKGKYAYREDHSIDVQI